MQVKEPITQLPMSIGRQAIDYNLIDDEFDAEFADQLAKLEAFNKHLYRPNTYLHKWWARRCGTTFRAILKHLVRDTTRSGFYTAGGLEGQIILDPMMGGGTTLHEAIRLGANVVGADIDPIPVLQARATLTEASIPDMKDAFDSFFDSLYSAVGHYYRAICPFCENSYEQRFVLYGLRRTCECQEALFVDSLVLRYNSDGSVTTVSPSTHDILRDGKVVSRNGLAHRLPLYEKGHKVCSCGQEFLDDKSAPYYSRYVPVAIVGDCERHGTFFAAPQEADLDAIAHADAARPSLGFAPRDFEIAAGPKSRDLATHGVHSYLDVFSSRQLLYLRRAIDLVRQMEPPIRLKLAMLVSTSVEFNSMLCGYKGAARNRPGAVRHVFAHHAYSFPCTALENNPVHRSRSSGTLQNLFHSRLVRGQRWAIRPIERRPHNGKALKVSIAGEVDLGTEAHSIADLDTGSRRFMLIQGSSVRLDLPNGSVDHVVTDPPYFDSVQYGDLAAFFRPWLRLLIPAEVEWDYCLEDSAVDQQANGNGQYETVLGDIFAECHRLLRDDGGRLVFTYHHWNPKAWAALTVALRHAGFALVNRYVIHAENPMSVHIANQNALHHDVILVFGKAGSFANRTWRAPRRIDTDNSAEFCMQCGSLLGHMLDTGLSDEAIAGAWRDAIL